MREITAGIKINSLYFLRYSSAYNTFAGECAIQSTKRAKRRTAMRATGDLFRSCGSSSIFPDNIQQQNVSIAKKSINDVERGIKKHVEIAAYIPVTVKN
jgi:hypothetical protein